MFPKTDYTSVETPPWPRPDLILPIKPSSIPISVSNLFKESSLLVEILLTFYISRFAFLTRFAIRNLS